MTRQEKIEELIKKMNDGIKSCSLDFCTTKEEIKYIYDNINI